MWFILALVAMACWSGGDLFCKMGSKPDDKQSHWKIVIAVGLVMGLHAAYTIFIGGVEITFKDIISYLPASIAYISSMILGYIGLRYIELSISSPICNTSGAMASLFLLIFFFDRAEIGSTTQLVVTIIGITLCAIGVLLLGIVESKEDEEIRLLRQQKSNIKYSKSILALLLPILYCFIDAAGTVADSFILESLDEEVANVAYELTFFLMAILSIIFVYVIKKEKIIVKREFPKLLGGICETGGQLAYIYAIAANAVAAAPIISCYCLLSVVWSSIFLKEKLSIKHYLSILIAVVGIVLLGIFGE